MTRRGWSCRCSLSLPMRHPLPPQVLGKFPTEAAHTHLPPGARKNPYCGWLSRACPQALGRASARADPLTMATECWERLLLGPDLSCPWPLASPGTSSLTGLDLSWLPTPKPLCTCHRRGSHNPSSHATSTCRHHQGRPECSRAASGADPCGWCMCRAVTKTTAEPKGRGN